MLFIQSCQGTVNVNCLSVFYIYIPYTTLQNRNLIEF